jgi:tRNA A-37 threonylcarbamoyl transferase component Bud32/dienelactone hydrolase
VVQNKVIGHTISHYRILAKLGEGGMGVVYKVEDTKLDRTVALKFLAQELTRDPEAKARFIHEAKAASALDHPNICTIHEIDETEDGRLFIAMACYEGETLKERIARGPLPLDDAVDIIQQVAKGLSLAHEQNIVHRDIKPANIFLTKDGLVKIVDFGLAKLAGQTRLTKTGTTMGTAAYMSPEQARGDMTDQQTDIWSLGAVLYEMVTGQIPFTSERELAVIYAILNEDPQSPKSLRKDLPSELEGLILRALCKDREHRFASANEIEGDLAQYQSDRISVLAQPTGFERFLRFLRRPPIIGIGLVFLIALAFMVIRFVDHSRKEKWARQKALPEIEHLAESGEHGAAYELALRAEQYIPEDPVLRELWRRISMYVTINSIPSGAKVFRKPYDAPQAEWEFLGQTPLDRMRIPRLFPRIRFEKEGYRVVNGTLALLQIDDLKLDEEGSIPEDMVRVLGGTQRLDLVGLNHLEPEDVSDFLMDVHEVTNQSYKRFVENGGYKNPEYWKYAFVQDGRSLSWEQAMALFVDRTGRPGPAIWEVGDYLDGEDDYPVAGVSWYEAAAYAEFVGKRLPTIFHWNRAAGPHRSADIIPLSNYNDRGPAPIGSYQGMSSFGIYDMAGNVREWCANRAHGKGRFILGGGWNDPHYSFSDAFAQPPWDRSSTNGFRCIRDLDEGGSASALEQDIDIPYRDFTSIEPISDETFEIYLNMFDYDKTDLNIRIESVDDDHPDWIREKVTFDAAYGNERVIVYLFLPKKGTPPFQTVIIFMGAAAMRLRSSENLKLRWSDFFVKGGHALIHPIYKSTYERRDGLVSDIQNETIFYKEHVIMWVKDLRRVVDYLETRADIDTEKLAYYGTSWGGSLGPIMMAAEERFKVGMLYVAGLQFQRSLPEVDCVYYCPHVKIPVLMLNGRYDYAFPVETSLEPMYELFGTPSDHKRLVLYDTGHLVPRPQLIEETLNWLDRYLGPVD